MSRRKPGLGADEVRVNCGACGSRLGVFAVVDDEVRNVDTFPMPSAGPRLRLEHGVWHGNCKCGARDRVRADKLASVVPAVIAAGLGRMPFRAPSGAR